MCFIAGIGVTVWDGHGQHFPWTSNIACAGLETCLKLRCHSLDLPGRLQSNLRPQIRTQFMTTTRFAACWPRFWEGAGLSSCQKTSSTSTPGQSASVRPC